MTDISSREIATHVYLIIGTLFAMAAGYMHGGMTEMFMAGSGGMTTLVGALGVVAKFGTPK